VSEVDQARPRSTQLASSAYGSVQLRSLRARFARGVIAGSMAWSKGLPMKPRDGPAAKLKEAIMTNQPALFGRKPTHRLFRVIGDGRSAIWTPIGAAWPNKDGLGFNINCDLVPLQGRIVMRAIGRDDEAGGQQ